MPFLFVDYDQGAGGEYFCANLSQSPQCVPLVGRKFPNGRTKVFDLFNQEFIKSSPRPYYLDSDPVLYNVVPSHRNIELARSVGIQLQSIRIKYPTDSKYREYLQHNKIKKVLLSPFPTGVDFIGFVQQMIALTGRREWVKRVDRSMDYTTIRLISLGYEPTEENKSKFINATLKRDVIEPTFDYDLVIPYESLFNQVDWVREQIFNHFKIEINTCWLDKYGDDYRAWLAST